VTQDKQQWNRLSNFPGYIKVLEENNYNYIDGIIRLPIKLENRYSRPLKISDISEADRKNLYHEMTHHFQFISTAVGWYLFKLGQIVSNLTISVLTESSVYRTKIEIPIKNSAQGSTKYKEIRDYQRQIDELIRYPNDKTIEELRISAEKYYPTNKMFFDAVERGELLEIDVNNATFLFGPEKIPVPVGLSTIMETMSTAVEYAFSTRQGDQMLYRGDEGGMHLNMKFIKPKGSWADVGKAIYYFPMIYCLQFGHNLRGKRSEPGSDIDLSSIFQVIVPQLMYYLFFYVSYFCLMMCVEKFPRYGWSSIGMLPCDPGKLHTDPGRLFLALLSEFPSVNQLFFGFEEGMESEGNKDLYEFFEDLVLKVTAVRDISALKTFEQSCNDFLADLDKTENDLAYREHPVGEYTIQSARDGQKVFEKFWQLSYTSPPNVSRIIAAQGFNEHVVRAMFETETLPPIITKNISTINSDEQFTFALIRHLSYKMLYCDNLACWQEASPQIPLYSKCTPEKNTLCQFNFLKRSDNLKSFCCNEDYIDMLEKYFRCYAVELEDINGIS